MRAGTSLPRDLSATSGVRASPHHIGAEAANFLSIALRGRLAQIVNDREGLRPIHVGATAGAKRFVVERRANGGIIEE
jgi:hypothetical protein